MLIRWTDPAVQDFTSICDQSDSQFGEARGRRTAMKIHAAAGTLAEFPHIGRPGRTPGTSELVLNGLPYIMIYRLKEDAVEIARILHTAQQRP